MGLGAAALLAFTVLVGCSPDEDGVELAVHLITDLRPVQDFQGVRTRVRSPGLEGRSAGEQTSAAFASHDYLAGERVAEIGSLPSGQLGVIVELLDDRGAVVAERPVLADVRSRTVITVVITADCERVECPRMGDAAEATACFGGRCVPPGCSDEDPSACGPLECMAPADCAPGPACTTARCISGACAYATDDDRCAPDEYCHPSRGCTVRAPATDAGSVDAGLRDAGVDGGPPDTGPPDTGPMCTPGCGTCSSGGCCTQSCDGCDLFCPPGCTCDSTCTGDACEVDCRAASCTLRCAAGADCEISCTDGAMCRLVCDPGSVGCTFGDCIGTTGIVACPGGIIQCNIRDCP